MRLHLVVLGMVLSCGAGCLLRPATISTRRFILTSTVTTNSRSSPVTNVISVSLVKLPPYVMRSSLVVRRSSNEIQYLEDALWAEPLDQSFQRALSADLAKLLGAEVDPSPGSRPEQRALRVWLDVERFDVTPEGQGTLIAEWRIRGPANNLKIGEVRLQRNGESPRRSAEAVAITLSDLVADLSKVLAEAISALVQNGASQPHPE